MHTDACELLKEWIRERKHNVQKDRGGDEKKESKVYIYRPGAGLVGYANNREHDLNENWKKKQLGHGAGADLPLCLHLTFTAPLHLSHGCQGISQKVREPSV